VSREPIPTWYFALVVVRRGDRCLLVHERKHGQMWYLPAGRVEPGETLMAAACRETLEETGVPIRLTGVIRVEHTMALGGVRVRVIFLGEPIDDTPPKTTPDDESLEAAWVSIDDLPRYPLRGAEVEQAMRYVAHGGRVHPLDLLQEEGSPYSHEATIEAVAPFFIVRNVPAALAFYRDRLGFDVTFQGPEPNDIFFGIVQRGAAMIMMKDVGVEPVPNYTRDIKQGIARWDAYFSVPDPDGLAAEFTSRGVELFTPLSNNSDGLRGFEVKDADGYLLYFGRVR
jgi:phosphatase NudJ